MTLYEQVILHHYKFHTKNLEPKGAMRVSIRQAEEAMQALVVDEPISDTTYERLVEWAFSQAPEVRNRAQSEKAAKAYVRALGGK